MVRCSRADLERWQAAASQLGLGVGAWLRMLAHREAPPE